MEPDADSAWLPATHSIPRTTALSRVLARQYEVVDASVRLLRPGLSDVFEVSAGGARYALRVYRTGWRTDDDIRWECELLRHLDRSGVAVTQPVPTVQGEPFVAARAPEGRRQLLLLTYAEGPETRSGRAKGSRPSVTGVAAEYGALTASIHRAGDAFVSSYPRFPLDLEHLIRRPVRAAWPLLRHRPRDQQRLTEQADLLAGRVESVAHLLDWGPCHGDITGANAVLRDGSLTMFDFDCGGPGWRAYDVACFAWSMSLHGAGPEVVARFRDGYESVRKLTDDQWRAGGLFQAVRQLWFIGMQTENAPDWGHGKADDDFFDRQLELLTRLVDEVG